jgi:hypothetical protein
MSQDATISTEKTDSMDCISYRYPHRHLAGSGLARTLLELLPQFKVSKTRPSPPQTFHMQQSDSQHRQTQTTVNVAVPTDLC